MPDISVSGTATSADGSVSVEVGLGGGLREVRLSRQAFANGADVLARNVVEASRRATARANHATRQEFSRAFGTEAVDALDRLGLGYDRELLADDDPGDDDPGDDPLRWRR